MSGPPKRPDGGGHIIGVKVNVSSSRVVSLNLERALDFSQYHSGARHHGERQRNAM